MENQESVYLLLTELCRRTAAKHVDQSKVAQSSLVAKMRSAAYETILKRSPDYAPRSEGYPIKALLSFYFKFHRKAKNVVEYKKSVELKKIIDDLRQIDFVEEKELVKNVLHLLVGLSNTEVADNSAELFQNPFSFGVLGEMLPKPECVEFGSPEPYPYYPSHVFQLPYSLKRETVPLSQSETYTQYSVETFKSKALLSGSREDKLSPISMPSILSIDPSSHYFQNIMDFPRLTEPRDLHIPCSEAVSNIKVSIDSGSKEIQEVFISNNKNDLDIWELAAQIDKDLPDDIWEIASKMPPDNERQLIEMSPREMVLWRYSYQNNLNELSIVSEKQFIRNIMYLIIGIETESFLFCEKSNCFYMKENLVLEGISTEHIKGYVTDLLVVGTYYKRLFNFAFSQSLEEHFHSNGLIYEAAREVIRRYLLSFRLQATEIFEDSVKPSTDTHCLPTLLQILYHIEPLRYKIETISAIYKLVETDSGDSLPLGADLMSYLFNEISMVTHKTTARVLFNSLFTICEVYFKFIERFIFEGELDDCFGEFFIRKDAAHVRARSKRCWDRGLYIDRERAGAVPAFLRPLAKFILLCGKSLRLLKQCHQSDPLVVLISSDHPSVSCCTSFQELQRQQQLLDVYRTRCLFVSGEPVTFDQIVLKQEADRKAFTEMASLKQAETLEKIVAERKRLAQLIIAEKQHSLRVLERAMLEAREARALARRRDTALRHAHTRAHRAADQLDARVRDDERNKMLEYYSKLNQEVEKSKVHTEWKIRRLQLDETRTQLLSTEERNLKREKLELEHKRNEEIMAMSIQSTSSYQSENDANDTETKETLQTEHKGTEVIIESEPEQPKAKSSTDVLMAICNAAKSLFGSKSDTPLDNKKELDAQGNIVPIDEENNPNYTKSSAVIGAKLNDAIDNKEYLSMREKAMKNKQKVMADEFGDFDKDNNKVGGVDRENNVKMYSESSVTQKYHNFIAREPLTEAQREAQANKLKVLGVEYNLPVEAKLKNDPANIAQQEAVRNKEKILGSETSMGPPIECVYKRDPATSAQEEALRNKVKILGSESSMGPPTEFEFKRDPTTTEQEEALRNKAKILGSESSMGPPTEFEYKKDVANEAQEEALRNKIKVLGSENSMGPPTDYVYKRDPANTAQEEAIQNKEKILGSKTSGLQFSTESLDAGKRVPPKKTDLTLNLKPFGDMTMGSNLDTPGEYLQVLNIETPTTADIPLEGLPTSHAFTPQSETNKLESADIKPHKTFLTSDGFDFSVLLDENVDSEIIADLKDSPESSPSKNTRDLSQVHSLINYFDDIYCFDEFDPFGVKNLDSYSDNHFTSKMDILSSSNVYTHPATIMEEVQKKPYHNMFSVLGPDLEDEKEANCDNIATLTACIQRSVMLPLTYQLEVVNNSILTYFLVNLDMYDHLRSLKEYFFLMDGEFSKSICQNLFARLVNTLNPQDLLNFATLHNILDKALGSSISSVHKFSENLSFTISESPLSFQHSSPDVLQCLSLSYAVRWPLNIILSPEALQRYARVFQFLVKMRRISWVLGQDFEALKLSAKLSRDKSRRLMNSPQYISVQIYRHVMASMIRALDNYIVTTCILSSWKEFENDLKKARTLDDLYDCHVVYVKKVLFRCLLNNRSTPVMKLLNDVFTVILKFSRVLKNGEWQQNEASGYFTHSNFSQLQELFYLFEKLAKYLHKVIVKLTECGYQRHLAELLTMVNFNGYYNLDSSKAKDKDASVQSP